MTRALDALVAERIFGRTPLWNRHGMHENGDIVYYWGWPSEFDVAPAYSTDIAAAFWALAQFDIAKYALFITRTDDGMWECEICELGDAQPRAMEWSHVSDSLPLAICLAILRAVGTPEEEIQRAMEVTA